MTLLADISNNYLSKKQNGGISVCLVPPFFKFQPARLHFHQKFKKNHVHIYSKPS